MNGPKHAAIWGWRYSLKCRKATKKKEARETEVISATELTVEEIPAK
jgi:hypothetical protein